MGKAGKKLGPPFTVYRVGASGDFPADWTIVGVDLPVFRRKITMDKLQYALKAATTVWYNIIADVEPFLLNDVFRSADAPYDPGVSYGAGATSLAGSFEFDAFSLAWHPSVGEPVGARLDRRCRIYRPLGTPDMTVNADGSSTFVWRQTERSNQFGDFGQALVLANGQFSFVTSGTASWVPIGLASNERPPFGDNFPPRSPGMSPIPRYFGWMPNLPGYEPSEGDRIITEDGARYVVSNPFRQEAGVVGSQVSLNRTISQDA